MDVVTRLRLKQIVLHERIKSLCFLEYVTPENNSRTIDTIYIPCRRSAQFVVECVSVSSPVTTQGFASKIVMVTCLFCGYAVAVDTTKDNMCHRLFARMVEHMKKVHDI